MLYLGSATVALVALLLAAVLVNYLRQQAERQHTENVRHLAQSVEQTLDGLVGTIDYVLQVSADEIEHHTASHGADAAGINRLLARQQERFPHIDLLRATNAQGEAIWGRGVDPAQRASLAQRDYFKRLRDDPRLGMVIAEPIIGRISQRWIWLMARRLNAPDGSFAGLVYASMFIDDIKSQFERIELAPGSVIALRDEQMRLVARAAFGQTPTVAVGDRSHTEDLQAALRSAPRAGDYVSRHMTPDGVARHIAYQHSPRYGYTIVVGTPVSVVAAQWHAQAGVVLACLAAFLGGLFFFVTATARRWDQAVSAATVAEQERDSAFLKALVRNIPELIWLKDPQGVYLACNAGFERFVNRPEAQIVGRTDYDLVDPELAGFFRRNDATAMAAGKPTTNEEWVTFGADGHRALLLTTKTPMRLPDGTVAGVLGVGYDISEARRTEEDLRESQQRLHRLNAELEARIAERTSELSSAVQQLSDTQFAMESVGIGISWVDCETGRFTLVNRFMVEFLGYSVEQFESITVPQLDPNFPPEAFQAFNERIRDEGHRQFETQLRAADGRLVPVEMTVYFDQRDSTRKPRLIAFMTGIAARQEAQRALREAKAAAEAANQAKSAFLANMSHEIRTPLNALLGLSYLLRSELHSSTQQDRLEKMDSAGRHLLSILNDILDLSKVEAGRLQLETSNFHLSAVLDHVYSLVRDSASAKGLTIEVDPDGVPHWLRGDPTRLRQTLLNFAGNAVKFTERGRIVLRAILLEEAGSDLLVRFEVQDTGIGLSAEQQTRLFRPFMQADSSTSRRFGGTGLGLALSKRLIELMNGQIGVDSVEGRGSTFWFTLPLQRGHGPMPDVGAGASGVPAAPPAEQLLRRQHRGARVLLAEDNAINVEVVQEMLHAVGLAVVVAENGRAAVQCAASGGFDLILMDMQMPEMDGLEATRRIREMPAHAATPIVALTANAFTDDRRACLDAGMDAMLTKPVDPPLLHATVLQALSRRPAAVDASGAALPAPVGSGTAWDSAALIRRLSALGGVDADRGLVFVGARPLRPAAAPLPRNPRGRPAAPRGRACAGPPGRRRPPAAPHEGRRGHAGPAGHRQRGRRPRGSAAPVPRRPRRRACPA